MKAGAEQRRVSLGAALAVLAAAMMTMASGTAAASEETPIPADEIAVRHCLDAVSKAESDARACIGVIADPCLDRPDESTAETTIACMDRETRLWERLLATRYGEFSALLDGESGTHLEEVQEAWNAYRDRRCTLGELLYPEEPMADIWQANCLLDETGRRAIEIGVLLDEANRN